MSWLPLGRAIFPLRVSELMRLLSWNVLGWWSGIGWSGGRGWGGVVVGDGRWCGGRRWGGVMVGDVVSVGQGRGGECQTIHGDGNGQGPKPMRLMSWWKLVP